MNTFYLISCVASKQSVPAPAQELYISALFTKARSYVKATGCAWFILSAEHGLLAPDQVIAPYEKTLNTMPIAARRIWSQRILQQLEAFIKPGDRVIFLAGTRYREFLAKGLAQRGVQVKTPLEGKRIGEQLQWLKEHTDGQ